MTTITHVARVSFWLVVAACSTPPLVHAQRTGPYTSMMKIGDTVATSFGRIDSVKLVFPRPPQPDTTGPVPPVSLKGIPFGPYNPTTQAMALFTGAFIGVTPDDVLADITAARRYKGRIIITTNGGDHSNWTSAGRFDFFKWRRRVDSLASHKIVMANAVAEGTIIGNSVMDEPQQCGSDSKAWGPCSAGGAYLTKAKVDSMCAASKAAFPTLPAGVVHDHDAFDPSHDYKICDFILTQYRSSKGSVTAFRDAGLAFGRRSKVALVFSLNVIDGGDRVAGCPKYSSANFAGNTCPMSAAELRKYGYALGPYGCALAMWAYFKGYFDRPDIQAAVREVSDSLARIPAKPCRRTG